VSRTEIADMTILDPKTGNTVTIDLSGSRKR
jgi:hypothetical protein